ncbi:1155_t:CDS:2 [Racocetra persica]|uniref:1155_t:CDS:1 n=1 Tax=Racocetra persica TaxID=160502 RepID=A0ACA9KRZ7_9GLOM|nr:1155_t:CDS:2 [Racocetra persica]
MIVFNKISSTESNEISLTELNNFILQFDTYDIIKLPYINCQFIYNKEFVNSPYCKSFSEFEYPSETLVGLENLEILPDCKSFSEFEYPSGTLPGLSIS